MRFKPQIFAGVIVLALISGMSLYLGHLEITTLATGGIIMEMRNLTKGGSHEK